MIDWLVLDAQRPWSALRSEYTAWAALEPRIPGDPGLGSPWGASRIGGWREGIFFNARQNPNTLWGRPWEILVLRQSADEITVECVGRNEAAEVRRTITLRRGKRTIGIESQATARRGPCHLALYPHAIHAMPGTPAPLLRLSGDAAVADERSLIEHDGTLHFRPRGEELRIASPLDHRFMRLCFHAEEVAIFLTDFASDYFTLEPFGTIRSCEQGESVHLWLEYELGG